MQTGEEERLDAIADEYIRPDPGRAIDQKILGMIVESIIPWIKGPEILELGFGDGQWTGRIIELFGHSHIVDGSRVLLDTAKQKYGPRITTYASLVEDFAPGRRFDTIIASFVLEHVEDPVQILRNTTAWLRPQGNVVVIVPNANSLHRMLAVCMQLQESTWELGATDRQMGHRRVYGASTMEHDIVEAGLAVVARKGFFCKLLPQNMMTGFSDEMLKGLMKLGERLPKERAASIAFNCTVKNSG